MSKPLSERVSRRADLHALESFERELFSDWATEIAALESTLADVRELREFDRKKIERLEKENAELWGRMHFIRDNIRQVEWHHLEMEYPEVAGWFDSKGGQP